YTNASFADKDVETNKTVSVSGIAISGSAAANYQLTSMTAATSADITPAPLTVSGDDQSRSYGAANPTLTASLSGFVGGEDSSVAAVSAPVGSYDIVPSAASGSGVSNYSISYHNGSLTVGRATVIASITAENKVYDGAASATIAGGSLSGVVGGDDVALSGG